MFDRYGKFIENSDIPLNKRVKYVDDEDTTLDIYENVCEVESGDGTVTITLPDVGEAAGMVFDVTATNGSTGNAVTVNDTTGSNVTSAAIAADGGFVTVVSTGMNWRVLAETLS